MTDSASDPESSTDEVGAAEANPLVARLGDDPMLARTGAVALPDAQPATLWHCGDPMKEQRDLLSGAAYAVQWQHQVIAVSGPERLSWLHSLTTMKVDDLPPGLSAQTLVLDPHGHIEHDLHLIDDGSTAWIIAQASGAGSLAEWLGKMIFMRRVEVQDVTEQWCIVADFSAQAELLPGVQVAWQDPWPQVSAGAEAYGILAEHPGDGWSYREQLVPRAEVAQALAEHAVAGSWATQALRIAAARPALSDTDHRSIPHELDYMRTAVHLNKGCYRGQETVARVHNLGRPPRRLVQLHLDGSMNDLPGPGAEVTAGGRAVGAVVASARHFELGPIALAMVKQSTPIEGELMVGSVAASQDVVVPPRASSGPKVRRLPQS